MRILLNCLPTTSLSGHHVILGHLLQLARWTRGEHEFIVLYHHQNRSLCRDLGEHVHWLEAPRSTGNWFRRTSWEATSLNRLLRREGIDMVFSASGAILPTCRLPQATMAMNPWCFASGLHRTSRERVRAYLQRRSYRYATEHASTMVYISKHIRDKYAANLRRSPAGSSLVAYSGIDDATYDAAEQLRDAVKDPFRILTVSAMAHWKNVETVVRALRRLHKQSIPAQLDLVGPWPDQRYRRRVEAEIARLDMTQFVHIAGKVSKEQLHRYYARARVYCLMSRCESFGIPSVEAQAFGTPVVASDCCAIPEVCGQGGMYGSADDEARLAEIVGSILLDDSLWSKLSLAARSNAEKYRWERCSQVLLPMFERTAQQAA